MLRITTLIENSPGEHHGLETEHGISLLVEKDGHRLLFDTGQSGAFVSNAAKLGLGLGDLEYVVLSHGHYDHSGGFRHLPSVATSFQLIVGPGFFLPKFALRDGAYDFLGNDFSESFLEEKEIRYRPSVGGAEEILPGVFVLSGFDRTHPDETVNPRFYIRKNGRFEQDRFDDEVLVALDTSRGLVVLLGCAHPGMRNMLDTVRKRLGKPIHAVLGGTHLVEAKGQRLDRSLSYLMEARINVIGVSHCTGKEAMERLRDIHEGFFHNVTGSSLFVE